MGLLEKLQSIDIKRIKNEEINSYFSDILAQDEKVLGFFPPVVATNKRLITTAFVNTDSGILWKVSLNSIPYKHIMGFETKFVINEKTHLLVFISQKLPPIDIYIERLEDSEKIAKILASYTL